MRGAPPTDAEPCCILIIRIGTKAGAAPCGRLAVYGQPSSAETMNNLCHEAASFLEKVYSEDSALFPFTTRLVGLDYHSVYDHPMKIRSTINCLLGLQEAASHAPDHPFLQLTEHHTERFLRLHESTVSVPADLGLLLLLLSGGRWDDRITRRTLARIQTMLRDGRAVGHMNAQDVTWLLWGAATAAQIGVPDAEPVAHQLFTILSNQFLPSGAVLPRHRARPGRFGIVSFGTSAYFLRAVHDYAGWCDSTRAADLFRRGLDAVLASQGPTGEWPWLLRNTDARPLDFYPVFSVHQNSMSMLFLFPALDDGIPDVQPAIQKSLEWMFGRNQLDVSMVRSDPFFIYRSFERKAGLPRTERFLRALWVGASGHRATLAANQRLVINRESRSYELGWILFAQSGNQTLAGLDLAG